MPTLLYNTRTKVLDNLDNLHACTVLIINLCTNASSKHDNKILVFRYTTRPSEQRLLAIMWYVCMTMNKLVLFINWNYFQFCSSIVSTGKWTKLFVYLFVFVVICWIHPRVSTKRKLLKNPKPIIIFKSDNYNRLFTSARVQIQKWILLWWKFRNTIL